MIDVNEAERLISLHKLHCEEEEVSLEEACDRILAEPILADRDGPPFDRVAMDGIGLSYDAVQSGQSHFLSEGMQVAGAPQLELKSRTACIEVMTGAVLPENCNIVIPYEQVQNGGDGFTIQKDTNVKIKQNVHLCASDFSKGDLLIEPGCRMNETHVAVAASVGKTFIRVKKAPAIALVTTGSELVDIDDDPEPYQIRKSNVYAGRAALMKNGFHDIRMVHISDDEKETEKCLKRLLNEVDVLILSGGVSKGKLDFVPTALEKCGVEKIFHRIAQKPGKPMWFGALNEKQVFACPGNPVSMLTCLHRYVLPALHRSLTGRNKSPVEMLIHEEVSARPHQTLFKPVEKIHKTGLSHEGKIIEFNGSGDFLTLTRSDGFIEIPCAEKAYASESIFKFYSWTGS